MGHMPFLLCKVNVKALNALTPTRENHSDHEISWKTVKLLGQNVGLFMLALQTHYQLNDADITMAVPIIQMLSKKSDLRHGHICTL